MKRRKAKSARAGGSSRAAPEDQDLAYLVHDRVALLGAVFSELKPKELRAMAPACVRGSDDAELRELCLDELLGISSKRLCAILDGAEPPTDTETSTSESEPEAHAETIDLDSSDSSHSKSSKSSSRSGAAGAAGAVGASVLQLLELSARARALRSQLKASPSAPAAPAQSAGAVVCISSDEEPRPAPAPVKPATSKKKKKRKSKEQSVSPPSPPPPASVPAAAAAVVKKEEPPDVVVLDSSPEREPSREREIVKDKEANTASDFSITIPYNVATVRKIQMDKDKVIISVPNRQVSATAATVKVTKSTNTAMAKTKAPVSVAIPITTPAEINSTVTRVKKAKTVNSIVVEVEKKDEDDDDELTLQVSDSEKLALFESPNKNNGSDSVDSEADSEDTDVTLDTSNDKVTETERGGDCNNVDAGKGISLENGDKVSEDVKAVKMKVHKESVEEVKSELDVKVISETEKSESCDSTVNIANKNINVSNENTIEVKCIEDIPVVASESETEESKDASNNEQNEACITDCDMNTQQDTAIVQDSEPVINEDTRVKSVLEDTPTNIQPDEKESPIKDDTSKDIQAIVKDIVNTDSNEETVNTLQRDKTEHSEEGEVSDKSSSDVEAVDVKPEVVLISDDETGMTKKKKKKEKKKKNKKAKKKDFSSESDANFRRKTEIEDQLNVKNPDEPKTVENSEPVTEIKIEDQANATESRVPIDIDSDNAYEVLEISDDSSCYEVEGVTVSKEPTSEEIEALSAKLDQIQRVDVITGETVDAQTAEDASKVSWKDRYLDSAKVKNVLKTANILNALRKKNKELKRKLQESKIKDVEEIPPEEVPIEDEIPVPIEGSVEHFNILQGSNKYVDPIEEAAISDKDATVTDKSEQSEALQKEMKKDAKQLLKMYKRLLKYNDMNKQKPKDPNKKKKKKKKNSPGVASSQNCTGVASTQNTVT